MNGNFFIGPNEFSYNMFKLSGSAVKIYILFRTMMNEKANGDDVWPSYAFIEKVTGVSRRTISKAINELIENGWINEIIKGFNTVNHYHVNDASRVNNALLETRLAGQKDHSSRVKNTLEVGQKLPTSRVESTLQVGQKVNSNNTNRTILNNNTKVNNTNINNTNKSKVKNALPVDIDDSDDLVGNLLPDSDPDNFSFESEDNFDAKMRIFDKLKDMTWGLSNDEKLNLSNKTDEKFKNNRNCSV